MCDRMVVSFGFDPFDRCHHPSRWKVTYPSGKSKLLCQYHLANITKYGPRYAKERLKEART